ncbi:hypothetical protein AMATHDRAFT_134656 [Amanita thiersii Skay4041]|uniref:NAD-dependent epimerase/dehydratase domain-containing protein n=1 Tax=Amanita thiersii Skay4041 TaxID=703135 RepID=A0A2A9NWC0_9AGAR|nr:hypothetical protein AMATHDRAFT_134656 [Amanita thiersii Skay4041]
MSKVVICGAGFLGTNIARAITSAPTGSPPRRIQISSRHPEKAHSILAATAQKELLLPPISLDVTKPESLLPAFKDTSVIVSLVGLLAGTPEQFNKIQWKGAENVAKAANEVGAKLIHISAIGADVKSTIPYMRTKGLAEQSIASICHDSIIIRPSLVFGPDDDFFNRFSRLARYLPVLPVFSGGLSRFQPVYVGDIAKAVELLSRGDENTKHMFTCKVVEAGGPEVFTFKEMMKLVLKYNKRTRPIISLPLSVGLLQAALMEKLPPNMFTVTKDQLQQLSMDNIVSDSMPLNHITLQQLFKDASLGPLTSVHDILPSYL